jgi:hypothetical protein
MGKRVKKGKSMGMSITQDRITALNNLYETDTQVRIKDLTDSQGKPIGTRVELRINI